METSIMFDIFKGKLLVTSECTKCHAITFNPEEFLGISLELISENDIKIN